MIQGLHGAHPDGSMRDGLTLLDQASSFTDEITENELQSLLDNNLPMVIDADLFSHAMLSGLLTREQTVLTPHPKEFTRLLKSCGIADIGVDELQQNRFHYVELLLRPIPTLSCC